MQKKKILLDAGYSRTVGSLRGMERGNHYMEKNEISSLSGSLMSTKITSLLIRELKTGIYAQAERLPAEMELAAELGVSRTVIRDALGNLENAGFIERVRGIGTVVNRNIVELNSRLDFKLEYNDMIQGIGFTASADNIILKEEPADENIAEKLEIDQGARIVCCQKRMLAGTVPAIYSIDCIPLELFGKVNYTALDWSQPVFDLLSHYCGLTILNSLTSVSATNATPMIRTKLEAKDRPLLLLEEVSFCKLNRPILYSLSFYTDFFHFSLLRKKF